MTWWSRRGLLAVCGSGALAVVLAGSARGASFDGVAPPLPPQPEVPAATAACPPSQAPVAMWRAAHREYDTPFDLHTDPSLPCHEFLAHDAQSLDRSVDGGRSWSRVFHDDAAVVCAEGVIGCTGGFQANGMALPAPGVVALSETGNGDALVVSQDSGTHWDLRNGGTPAALQGRQVLQVQYAPSDPRVIYALVATPGASSSQVKVSRNGGQSWATAAAPPLTLDTSSGHTFLAVHPTQPSIFWVLTSDAAGDDVLLNAAGYGTQWLPPSVVPGDDGYVPTSFAVISTARHQLRLIVTVTPATLTVQPKDQVDLLYSDSLGATWAKGPTPADSGGLAMVADPARPDVFVYVGARPATGFPSGLTLRASVTTDGFDTSTPLPDPITTPFVPMRSPYPAGPITLDAGADGVFHLVVAQQCAMLPQGCPRRATTVQSEYVIRPMALGPAQGSNGGAVSGVGVGSIPPGLYVPPPAGTVPMTVAGRCVLPTTSARPFTAGALAFDGHELLYTDWQEDGPLPYTGLIHKMDPRTCAAAGTIVVRFQPADIRAALTCGGGTFSGTSPDYVHPHVDDMTYDARRDVIWATLSPGAQFVSSSCAFRVDVTGLDSAAATGVAHLAWSNGCGVGLLSYDQFDDGIWTCTQAGSEGTNGGEIAASTGGIINTCDPTALASPGASGGGVSTWMTGGPHRLYVEYEDDQTLAEFDTVSCRVLVTYEHAPFSEATGEEEQGACDGSTFGVDQSPALWLRDAQSRTAVAYAIPGGYCPVYTSTTYIGPPTVHQGQTASLCARLTLRGRTVTLTGLPITFVVGGNVAATATTAGGGVACIALPATMPVARYPVESYFSGDSAYYGSRGDGLLDVVGPLGASSAGTVAAIAAPFGGGGGAPVEPVTPQVPSSSAQLQPELPPQPQPLSQAQSVPQGQPMGVAEAERQVQVAPVAVPQAVQQPDQVGQAYQMSALPPADSALPLPVLTAVATLGAVMALGIGWVLRTPALVRAGAARRRERGVQTTCGRGLRR